MWRFRNKTPIAEPGEQQEKLLPDFSPILLYSKVSRVRQGFLLKSVSPTLCEIDSPALLSVLGEAVSPHNYEIEVL